MPIPAAAKILVIDDFDYMARTVRGLLSRIGIGQSVVAGDGNKALEMLGSGSFDLAICDLVLNCPDGLDVLRAVRADPALAEMPFVIYTLDRSPGTLATIRSAGASGYLCKPFGEKALREVLETAFEARTPAMSPYPGVRDDIMDTPGMAASSPQGVGTACT